jgi:hypothetical protein
MFKQQSVQNRRVPNLFRQHLLAVQFLRRGGVNIVPCFQLRERTAAASTTLLRLARGIRMAATTTTTSTTTTTTGL